MLFTIMTMKKSSTTTPSIRIIQKTTSQLSNKINKFLNKKIENNLYHHKDYQRMYQYRK